MVVHCWLCVWNGSYVYRYLPLDDKLQVVVDMCEAVHSESGFLCSIQGCPEYIKLLSEKSHLEGRCAGLEEGNKRNLEAIKRQDARLAELLTENERLKADNTELLSETKRLRDESTRLFKERNRSAAIVEKADALAEAVSSCLYGDREVYTMYGEYCSYKEARNG